MAAYVDDDMDDNMGDDITIPAHLLTGQNIRWVNFLPNFSHFGSTFSAILVAQF